jgi:hypothetical protein
MTPKNVAPAAHSARSLSGWDRPSPRTSSRAPRPSGRWGGAASHSARAHAACAPARGPPARATVRTVAARPLRVPVTAGPPLAHPVAVTAAPRSSTPPHAAPTASRAVGVAMREMAPVLHTAAAGSACHAGTVTGHPPTHGRRPTGTGPGAPTGPGTGRAGLGRPARRHPAVGAGAAVAARGAAARRRDRSRGLPRRAVRRRGRAAGGAAVVAAQGGRWPLAAAALVVLAGVLDGLDGAVALHTGRRGRSVPSWTRWPTASATCSWSRPSPCSVHRPPGASPPGR